MSDYERLQGLARLIAVEMGKAPIRPALRIIRTSDLPQKPAPTLDATTRESHLRMIRHLNKRWGLQIIVDQATFGRASIDDLSDDEVVNLHQALHRAHECVNDGISLEDAGLIRSR